MYEIKKETKSNGDVFLHLYFNGSYATGSTRLIHPNTESKKLQELKNIIKTHKETGKFEKEETLYTEN